MKKRSKLMIYVRAELAHAEIHLAKHRNGPTGTEKLAWLNRYAKFADLAGSA